MLKKRICCAFLSFSATLFFINLAWCEQGRRTQLKSQFAPKNVMQMQNVSYDQLSEKDRRVPAQSHAYSASLEEQPIAGEYAIYQSTYETKIEEEIAVVKGKIDFEVFKKSGWVKIPLVSSDVGLKDASLNGKPSFVARDGSRYILFVNKAGRYTLNLEFFIKVKREREHGPGSLAFQILPSPISILDVQIEDKDAEIFVEPSIKIETEKLPKRTLATVVLPFTEVVTVRWSKALPKEVIPELALAPKVYVETVSLVSIGDGVARCLSNLNYSILQSEVSNLKVSLPADVGILEVTGNQIRDWKVKNQDGRQLLDVYLNYGVKGNYMLNVVYERNIGAGSVTAQIPDINVLGTERQRGSVGIEALTNIELSFNKLNEASAIDVKQLPQQIWWSAKNPVLLAFKYLKIPYGVIVDVTKHEEVPVLVATIDSANYITLYTDEGKVLTKATYQVRNNVKQFVRLSLPKGAELWSSFVSGKPVKPAKDKEGRILIPLEKSQVQADALTQFPVEIVYLLKGAKLHLLGGVNLQLPQLDIPQSELLWSVYLPKEFNYHRFSGDVKLARKEYLLPIQQMVTYDKAEEGAWRERQAVPLRKAAKADLLFSGQQSADQVSSRVLMEEEKFVEGLRGAQAKGVLPIKIDIPETGKLYRFTKLLVTDEKPHFSVFYVRGFITVGFVFVVILGALAFVLTNIKPKS
jgi:hypothetical protein